MNRKIKSIGIKNFQSWEDGIVSFEDFNILEGKSNSGKSAVVRAIAMVINDDWDSSWLRKGESTTTADLMFTDGLRIVRSRGSVNNILVYRDGTLTDNFSDFGKNYPEEMDKILNTDDYNIANQFDGHFFISLSPNKRAQILGKFSDLGRIDSLLSENQRILRQSSSNAKFLEENQLELEYELSMVKDISSSLPNGKELKRLNDLIDKTLVLSNRMEKINELLEIDSFLSLGGHLDEAYQLYQSCQLLVHQLSVLNLERDIVVISDNILKLQDKIKGQVCPICNREISF